MHRNRGGVLLGILVALLVLILAAVYIGPRVFFAYMANKTIRENAQLALHPVPLRATEAIAPQSPLTRIAAFGYELSVPWGKVEDSWKGEYFDRFSFAGSTSFHFQNPAKQMDQLDVLNKAPDPRQRDAMAQMYGLAGVHTHYDALRATLEWKPPASVSAFDSQEKLMAQFFQITQKQGAVQPGTSVIYECAFGDLRGFQLGEPGKDDEIRVHVFDKDDQHLEWRISRGGVGIAPLTQGEINFVVKSLRRAPVEPEKSPAEKKAPRKTSPQKAPA
jgi:hypothetical protein